MTPRERLLVLAILPVALIVAGYQFAWKPLVERRDSLMTEIASYRHLAMAARAAADRPVMTVAPADPTPLASRVTQSAEAAGLSLTRLEPEAGGLRLTLPETPFDTVVAWLARLEPDHGIRVTVAEIERRTAPGTVTARFLVETLQ